MLYGLGAARDRVGRYTVYRWAVGITFTLAVALLPITGLLRFDLWHGNHEVLGAPADFVAAAKAFAFPFLAINVLIVVASRFLGRYLCGFVCPVGSLARLGEWVRWSRHRGRSGYATMLVLALASALLASVAFSFWVDWRVFVAGSTRARLFAAAFLGGMAIGFFVLVRWMGLRFCLGWCPSGVYFALLGPKTWNGVEFAHPEECTDCHACERTCPMDLSPRELATAPAREGTGLYPDGLSNHALCIRCGDCVTVCEATTAKGGAPTPLRMGWLGHDSPPDRAAEEVPGR